MGWCLFGAVELLYVSVVAVRSRQNMSPACIGGNFGLIGWMQPPVELDDSRRGLEEVYFKVLGLMIEKWQETELMVNLVID